MTCQVCEERRNAGQNAAQADRDDYDKQGKRVAEYRMGKK